MIVLIDNTVGRRIADKLQFSIVLLVPKYLRKDFLVAGVLPLLSLPLGMLEERFQCTGVSHDRARAEESRARHVWLISILRNVGRWYQSAWPRILSIPAAILSREDDPLIVGQAVTRPCSLLESFSDGVVTTDQHFRP